MAADPLSRLTLPVRRRIAGAVVGLFNDRARGERPVGRSDHALFARGSAIWRVHGDVTSMMVGGVSGLLLQMLHPAVLAGVWDHSNFRADMHGRLRRTARFIAATTYGEREAAEAAIARVRKIHDKVAGTLPDGAPYRASDPRALAWVHVTEATSFLAAWRRYGDPTMTHADRDRYFAEIAVIGRALGADPVPETERAADALIASYRPELAADARTREVAHLVLNQPPASAATLPFQRLTMEAGVDLLPAWARAMHGFPERPLSRPLVRAGAAGIARTLRWAFG